MLKGEGNEKKKQLNDESDKEKVNQFLLPASYLDTSSQ